MIEKERPDALLATLGGQTALNLAQALHEDGTLERFGVELIGADYDAIRRAEDRELFRETMRQAGLRVAALGIVTSVAEAERAIDEIGLPLIVRPAFTLGGHGGGIARTEAEFHERVSEGLNASPINQVLLEESVIGWGEFELEVMRDHNDNASSSARSRTSTRWASTRATPSRSRRSRRSPTASTRCCATRRWP